MAFTEDLAPFFNRADFADDATVGGVELAGIFDNDYIDTFGIVAGSQPSLLVASAAVSAIKFGDAVVIGAANYTVNDIKPGGTGLTRILLSAAT